MPGQAMETRPAAALLDAPSHPYTAALLAALPEQADAQRRLATIPGVVPGIADRPRAACSRRAAAIVFERCAERPALLPHGDGAVRCFAPL